MNTQKQKIYEFLRTIPHGKVVTYKTIGQLFKLHPRAVWRIIGQNDQQDKYPCYKVIGSTGTLNGYNLGLNEKIKRLQTDGIPLKNNKIPSQYFRTPLQ